VHAVGARGRDEVGPVVEHEGRARLVAQRAGDGGAAQDGLVVAALLAQLEDVDALGQRGPQDVGERAAAGAAAAHEVQPGVFEIVH
jgi:NAD(P)H-hydrate repair Nnr-like enzyme with NAD(P)H-hydrate epimerase domain